MTAPAPPLARTALAGIVWLLTVVGDPISGLGQATSGSFQGKVADPTQALVAGAAVRAQNEATGLVQSTETDSSGNYVLPALPPGTYTLTIEKEGFAATIRRGIRLAIDQKMKIDVDLAIGPRVESVTAVSSALQTQSADTGEVLESMQILDLPLLGRNFLDLTRLTAGVSSGGGGNNLNIAVNGQREFANSIVVDGIETSSNRNNDTTVRPSVDAVEEFKVLTGSYAAEFGRASGAVVAVQTRSGTNHVHGDLYEFLRPTGLAARSFFAADAPPLKQHDFGGTIGGPIRKDRTFGFVSYEGVRLRNSFSFLSSVPPAGQIRYLPNGDIDLAGLRDPFTGKQVPVFDPNSYAANYYASQFPGNLIPGTRVSAAGKAILQKFFPPPDSQGSFNGWFNNFVARQDYRYDSDAVTGRVDHLFSSTDRLSAAYHYGSLGSTTGDRFAGSIPVNGGGDADYGDQENGRNQEWSLSETHLISNRWLNEVRLGYTRSRLDQLSLLNNQDLASFYGLGNVNLPGLPQTSGFPYIYLGFGAQTGGSTFKPLHFLDSNYNLADSVSVERRLHQIKVGVQFRVLSSNPFFALFPTGFQYYGGPGVSLTSDPNYAFHDPAAFYYNGGSDIADLLLGLPYSVSLGQQLTNPVTHSWESGAYFQDTWQITPRLVLSYGLRYEYFSPWTEAENHFSNFDSASGRIILAGQGGHSASLVDSDRNNFAPRAGLAYRAGSRMVIRAGWGVYYSPENDGREDVLTKNYPFAVEQTAFNDIYGGPPFAYVLDRGLPRITVLPSSPGAASLDPSSVQKSTGAAQNLFMVDPHLRTGYSQLYNFTLQRQFTPAISAEAGYVGSVSRKLPYAVGNLNVNNQLSAALGTVQALFSEGSSSFQSLQLKSQMRFSGQVSLLAAYTFGKNMDNGPAPFNLGHNQNSNNWPQSALNLSLERAVADDDLRHSLKLTGIYEVPLGKGQRFLAALSGWRQALFGLWQLNGLVARQSGLPVNVVRNPQLNGYQGLRPDVVSNPNLTATQRTLARYFNTGSFMSSRFAGPHKTDLGNAGRNLVRGPGLTNLDFSAFKEFPLLEKLRLQFRFEVFNLTNTPHFANPDGNMSDGSFGSITQTIGNARIVQFAVKIKW